MSSAVDPNVRPDPLVETHVPPPDFTPIVNEPRSRVVLVIAVVSAIAGAVLLFLSRGGA